MYEDLGASSCAQAHTAYLGRYNTRMTETGGMSPVSITGYFSSQGATGSFHGVFTLEDPVTLSSLQATFFVYEDGLVYQGTTYEKVTRVIKSQAITLGAVGEPVNVDLSFTVNAAWVQENLHAIAIIQKTTNPKTIYQAANLTHLFDFTVNMTKKVASVPNLNGPATLPTLVKNASLSSDILHLGVDQSIGWATDFQVAGDPNWYTSLDVSTVPGEEIPVTVRVQTGADKRIGTGHFYTTSTNTGRVQNDSFRIFNGSYSVLLVDDDQNAPYETAFTTPLTSLGYLYEDWDVYFDHSQAKPKLTDMAGFDIVIWSQGYRSGTLLTADDIAAIEAHINNGGGFYYPQMAFLSSQSAPNEFTTTYLGIGSWVNDTKSHTEYGVAGDPISDGMAIPLTFEGGENGNKVDTTNPAPTAVAFFISETSNPNAVRNDRGPDVGRVVFSSIVQNAFPASGTYPNNNQTVVDRVIKWVCRFDPAAAPETVPAFTARSLSAQPNPFFPGTSLSFSLASGSPVHLTVVDASGRLVRTLLNGTLPAGPHQFTWDGTDQGGNRAASGIYFAKLATSEGESSGKLVLTR